MEAGSNDDAFAWGTAARAGRPRGIETKVVRLPVPLADLAKRLADRGVRSGDVGAFLNVEPFLAQSVALVGATAPCCFPSPADDYLDRPLDFNELLITHQAATFAVRVTGLSMTGAGIYPGDIAVVDRALTPAHERIVWPWSTVSSRSSATGPRAGALPCIRRTRIFGIS